MPRLPQPWDLQDVLGVGTCLLAHLVWGHTDLWWFSRICAGHDVPDFQCRHVFWDSNSWTALGDVPPKELHWSQHTNWRLGWCSMLPSASLNPVLWMLSSCRRLVFDAVPYTTQPWSSLERIMAPYSIRSVSRSPPHFKCTTTQWRFRASLHCVFNTLMCFLKERCESHHSPRNFVESSTDRNVSPILIAGGLGTLDRGAVKCMTLHLWAANLKPFLVAHSCMAFTPCCKLIGLDLFNDDTRPSGHISRPAQVNVSQSGFHSLNNYSSLIILYTSGG